MDVQTYSKGIRFELDPIVSLAPVEQLWTRLEKKDCPSFFVSWTWIGSWLRCLPEHVRPALLVAMRGNDAVGAAILVFREERRWGVTRVRQFYFNATGDRPLDCIWIEHNGFVGALNDQRTVGEAFLYWLSDQSQIEEIIVPLAAESALWPTFRGSSVLHRESCYTGFAAELPAGNLDDILAGLSRNTRQHLRRNLRDAAGLGGVRIELPHSLDVALAWFGEMKTLHIRSWTARNRRHAFHFPFWERFHRALIQEGHGTGSVRLRRLSAGETILGYLYDFRTGDRVYAYQSGFDDHFAELRPGYIAHLLAMEQAACNGVRRYDFLAGDNQLKRSLGGSTYRLCTHRFGRRTWALRAESMAKLALKSVRA